MSTTNSPRAVLFDVDGVLIHSMFHPDPTRCRRWDQHMKDDLGIGREDWKSFFGPRFAEVVRGRKSIIPELAEFLPSIGFQGNAMDFLAYWFKHDNQLNTGMIAAIKEFIKSPDVSAYMATNQEHLRAFHLWNTMGFSHFFKDMLYAANLGAAKPDMAFYAAVDARLGPQDQPPLFFDDVQKNVDAANAHGWEAILFDELEDFTNHPWVAARLP